MSPGAQNAYPLDGTPDFRSHYLGFGSAPTRHASAIISSSQASR